MERMISQLIMGERDASLSLKRIRFMMQRRQHLRQLYEKKNERLGVDIAVLAPKESLRSESYNIYIEYHAVIPSVHSNIQNS